MLLIYYWLYCYSGCYMVHPTHGEHWLPKLYGLSLCFTDNDQISVTLSVQENLDDNLFSSHIKYAIWNFVA